MNAIANRLSLRPPQKDSLAILARFVRDRRFREIDRFGSRFRGLSVVITATSDDFEREFPSLCFALATGVGKTRLMGAFIAYLHRAEQIDNFFRLGSQSDDLQQAHRRLHFRYTQICVSGNRRVCNHSARDYHGRQL